MTAPTPSDVVHLYDTTLRDGCQAEDINFSVADKVRVAHHLDDLGVHYIEGGWPGSNPRDGDFFKEMMEEDLHTARLTAFGATRRTGFKCDDDMSIQALLKSGCGTVTIVGKSWDLHVHDALQVSLEENLELINDTIRYLKERADEVIYDAEHFFDGYTRNSEYALKTLHAAADAGADVLCLCDTNGGTMPETFRTIIATVQDHVATPLGVHCHNDSDLAVANSILAVKQGVRHVQGTINGFGERCGNANLCSIIPAVSLKLGLTSIPEENLKHLVNTSRFVYEMANMEPPKHQPYVGRSAFAHKGGIHVSAVRRNAETYEHIQPERVGNTQRVLVSDLSGRSNIVSKVEEFGLDISSKSPEVTEVLDKVKMLENEGYQFEGAEASLELIMQESLGEPQDHFRIVAFRVIDERRPGEDAVLSEATIQLSVDGQEEYTVAQGDGPVNALDKAMRKALERFYPQLGTVHLRDYKVRVISGGAGTASRVRVLVSSGDGTDTWGTVGVDENIINASCRALVDSINYKLYKDAQRRVAAR